MKIFHWKPSSFIR